MVEKRKTVEITSPKGEFLWPKLNEPDYGTDKYPKKDGKYNVKLILEGKEAEALISKLSPHHAEAVAKGKEEYDALPVKARKANEFKEVPFFNPEYDEETEEETGRYIFNFKMKASGVAKKTGKKWERAPAIFDAKGHALTGKKIPSIGSGTIGRVNFQVLPFFTAAVGAGLSLRLEAVQLIDVRSFGERDAKGYGFGEEEGFDGSDLEDETFTDHNDGDSSEDEDDF